MGVRYMHPTEKKLNNEDIVKYLNDITKIEQSIYIIDTTISSSRNYFAKKASELQLTVERLQKKRRNEEERIRNDADIEAEYELVIPKRPSEPKPLEEFHAPHNGLGKGLGIPASIICFFVALGMNASGKSMAGWLIVGALALIIGICRDKIKNSSETDKLLIEYKEKSFNKEREIEEYEKALKKYEADTQKYIQEKKEYIDSKVSKGLVPIDNEINQAIKKYQIVKSGRPFNDSLPPILEQREQLQAQLSKMYNFDIIPVDYRTFDCAIMLLHIFRNGLADNMRDAINLYETRVFRGELVRGMNNIINQLDTLSVKLGQVGHTLNRMQADINIMSEDLCQLVENSNESLGQNSIIMNNQNKLFDQAKLTRMAMEATAESNENIQYFINKWDKEFNS